jgi:hypothetical protein
MTFHTNSSSNVLTERMRINQNGDIRIGDPSGADGRVMIKTHSPVAYSASGYNGTNANIRLMTAGNPPAGSTTGISFGISGASEAYIGAVQNSSSLAEIVFQTYNGSSYGERARINSNGYFTKPNQPFFQAFSGGGSWTSGQTVVWSNTLNNVGNGYNTSTGRFTAPVAGVYIFRADFRAPNNSTTNILDIKSSTGGLTRYEVPSGGNWYHTTVAAIYKLNAGDYVYCEAAAGTLQPDGNSIDRFEGYLLG